MASNMGDIRPRTESAPEVHPPVVADIKTAATSRNPRINELYPEAFKPTSLIIPGEEGKEPIEIPLWEIQQNQTRSTGESNESEVLAAPEDERVPLVGLWGSPHILAWHEEPESSNPWRVRMRAAEKTYHALESQGLKPEEPDPEYGEKLEAARTAYEMARAEAVHEDIKSAVHEEIGWREHSINEQKSKPGRNFLGRVMDGYRWLKDKNMSRLERFRDSGRITKGAASLLSLRTGISGALTLGAFLAPGLGTGVFAARRVLAGAGTAFGTYEFLKRRAVGKLANTEDFNDLGRSMGSMMVRNEAGEDVPKDVPIVETKLEDVISWDNLTPENVAEKMHAIIAHAEIQGSWDGLEEVYEKTKMVYEKQMAVAIALGQSVNEQLNEDTKTEWAQLVKQNRLEHGVTGMDVIRHMQDKAREMEKSERSKHRWRVGGSVAAGVVGGFGFSMLRHTQFFSEFFGLNEAQASAALPTESPEIPAEAVSPATDNLGDKITKILEAREAAKTDTSLYFEFAPGEGPIHQARKAIAQAMSEHGEWARLTQGQRIWLEERLWELKREEFYKASNLPAMWHPGDMVPFRRDMVQSVVNEMQDKFKTPEAIQALDTQFRGVKIPWDRYAYKGGYSASLGDHGVRYGLESPAPTDWASREIPKPPSMPETLEGTSNVSVTESAPTSEAGAPSLYDIEVPRVASPEILIEHTALPSNTLPYTVFPTPDMDASRLGGLLEVQPEAMPSDPTAISEIIRFKTGERLSGLASGEYELIAHGTEKISPMRMLDLIKVKGFWDSEHWPEGIHNNNHRDIMHRLRFKDAIIKKLNSLPFEEYKVAQGLDVGEFYERYFVIGKLAKEATAR